MDLRVQAPEPGSYVPLRKIYKNPKQTTMYTMELLRNRVTDFIERNTFQIVVLEDGDSGTKST